MYFTDLFIGISYDSYVIGYVGDSILIKSSSSVPSSFSPGSSALLSHTSHSSPHAAEMK
jgi:hypothetical protein